MAFGDLAIDAVLVVCAVSGERGDGAVDLIKQGADLRAVVLTAEHRPKKGLRRESHDVFQPGDPSCRVGKALARDVKKRFSTATEALEAWATEGDGR